MSTAEDVPLEAPSLLQLSAQFITKKHDIQHFVCSSHLPLTASHALLTQHIEECSRLDKDKQKERMREGLRAWCDAQRLPLSHLNLSGGLPLDNHVLSELLIAHQNSITSLDLSEVSGITWEVNGQLQRRNVMFPNLRSLRLTSTDLFSMPGRRMTKSREAIRPRSKNVPVLGEEDLAGAGGLDQMRENRGGPSNPAGGGATTSGHSHCSATYEEDTPDIFTSRCPGVTSLHLQRTKRYPEEEEMAVNELLSHILEPLKELTALDISYWFKVDDLRCLHPLNLTSLILYDVPDLYRAMDSIVMMTELLFLDVSQSTRENGVYPKPATELDRIVTSLPKLKGLDISGTNLASAPGPDDWPVKCPGSEQLVRSDIVGLRYLKKPLDYIGLFYCDSASHYVEIPARSIAGDANEEQVITALHMYQDRAGLLQTVLNESYQLYRFGNSNPLVRHTEALHLVLEAMQRHLDDSTLQIAGSASLFYIIRKVSMNRDTKRQVVSALLNGMEKHMDEQVMVRNCCLSLCQFEIPQEILFDYSRLAVLLVTVLQHHNADNLTQRIVVFLLNSMACHVEGDQKVQVGSFGAIEMILDQIRRKLLANTCDDVMEVGWSFLWNITDETPVNCERFLRAEGLVLFQKCFDSFRDERELVRNMMGLIGNIAEVETLRAQLMNDDYIKIFVSLLTLVEESIEISYNSAGVLAHMVSDSDEIWATLNAKRSDVMESIVKATQSWRLDTRRFINYRSFRPILRLLPLWDAYASQHWAVWALANLTTTDGNKYCAYVLEEGGLVLLQDLVNSSRTKPETRELAVLVLDNIKKWGAGSEVDLNACIQRAIEAMETQ